MPTYADHVDYSGYEARHVGLERLDAAPSDVFPGRFYFDDTIGSLGVYNGSSWSYPNVPITEFDDLTVNGTLTVGNINSNGDIIMTKSGLGTFGGNGTGNRVVYGMFNGSAIQGAFFQAFGNTSGGSGVTPAGGSEFVIDASIAATKFNILAYNGSAFPIIFSARSDGSIVIPALGGSGDRVVFTDNAGVLTAGTIPSPTPGGANNAIQVSEDGVFTGYDTFTYDDDGTDFQNLVVGKSGSARGITVYGSIFTQPGYGNFVAAAGQGTFYGSLLTNAGYVNGPITIAPLQQLIINAAGVDSHSVFSSTGLDMKGTLTIKQAGLSNGLVLQAASAGDPYSPLILFKDTLFNISAQIAMFYGGDLVLQSQFNTHIKFGTDNSFFNVAITAYPYDVGSGGYSMLVKSPIANGVPLMVRAFTSQTANILEIQQIDTTVLSGFDKDGAVFATTALQMHASTYIGVKGSGVRIGADSYTTAPVSSAILELVSTTKGFVPTRHTTVQRLAMTPEESMLVYDLDLKGWFGYNGTDWVQL